MGDYHPAFNQHCVKVEKTASVAQTDTKSGAIDIEPYNNGSFYLPAEFNGDIISFEVAENTSGTFAAAHVSSDGSALSFTAPAGPRWYDIPSEVMGAGALKFVTSVAAAAAADITVVLKAGA